MDAIVKEATADNFASLAKKHSEDTGSKVKGGDLGWFGKGRMVPEFEEAAFGLEPGATGPIEDPRQLIDYLEAGCKPKSQWKIGTEHEKFGFCQEKFTPVPHPEFPVDYVRTMRASLVNSDLWARNHALWMRRCPQPDVSS